ncbi:patatin-like phospholipase family protein [Gordonia sp. LSe1-13]|uniref:Patatin-like phospholipase family protein n=1 Tax=Gordonia sesuvii TaxID=3116777 RepID=A0ABU7MFT1_9ACTN|nr:patatin-like phospholipase family protein [Gordonia sp. LSe1-13]
MSEPSVIPSRMGIRFSAARKPTDRNTVVAVLFVIAMGIALIAVTIVPSYEPGILAWEFGYPPTDPDRLEDLRDTLAADLGLILGYVLALGGLAFLGRLLAFTKPYRTVSTVAAVGIVAAGLFDLAENLALLTDWRLGGIAASAVFATAKFALLLPAGVVAAWAVVSLVETLVARRWLKKKGADAWHPAPSDEHWADEPRWDRAYLTPNPEPVGTEDHDRTAICLSGGGVRSACVALGAMQSLTKQSGERTPLHPDYVVSVSGGGYTAGALLQAMRRHEPNLDYWSAGERTAYEQSGSSVQSVPLEDLFDEGSEEYDYVRRRASYIADSPGEMATALVVIAKNMLLSLTILFTPAVIAGVLAGLTYAHIPIAAVVPVPDDAVASGPALPEQASLHANSTATVWMLGVLAAICFVFLVAAGFTEAMSAGPTGEKIRAVLSRAAICFAIGVAIIAAITVAAPGLLRVADSIFSGSSSGMVWSASAVALLNYTAVLAAILWRNRGIVGKIVATIRGKTESPRKGVPRGAIQLLLVLVTLLVVTLTWFATFGGAGAWTFDTFVSDTADRSGVWIVFALAVTIALALSFYDVTSSSLHPFYRRRLARAFAVRRLTVTSRVGGRETKRTVAVPYPSSESTELADFHTPGSRPHFVFAAAATISGTEKPAAGLNAVPFTFATDYVGGPDVGWVSTRTLKALAPPRLLRDLTVQAAVAVSGAAFASAMGRMGSGYQKLFAISGARLGTWLPNPMFLAASASQKDNWAWPHGLPRYRGAGYLYREVLGINSARGRLLQISDGGHYDNLGLVEALRRRCTTIVCIDATGDTPPNLSTLADAVRLARAELGVTFTFPGDGAPDDFDAQNLAPGTGESFDPDDDFAALNARITKGCVVAATFTYPPSGGVSQTGRLLLAKAVLWQECPDWLMTYANTNSVFPHDSTSDQWFDEGQFAAYTELGRLIGAEALRARELVC